MKSLLLFPLFLLIVSFAYCNEKNIKFGKVDKEDLEMTVYDKDTTAVAVVLYEYGDSEIEYIPNSGWRLSFSVHRRIKILKKEGVEYADFQIGLSKDGSYDEEVNGLKAITFNLENGKIEKTELSNKDVHLDDVNRYYQQETFSMPNVKVGSVLDIKYSIDCKAFFRNMRPWMFQHSIPTVYSEYLVTIPEYFMFRKFTLGFEKYASYEEGNIPVSKVIVSKSRTETRGLIDTQYDQNRIAFNCKSYHWVAKDMPAFKKEAYISTEDNYIQQVQFELQSVQFPGDQPYNYSESWESINKNLIEDEDFGKIAFGNARFLEDETNSLLAGVTDDAEKLAILYSHVRANYKFTGRNTIYSKGLRKTVSDKNGNVADINFLLAAHLKNAGFTVKPMVLSTRSNGMFLYPTVTSFNYVVLIAEINGKSILLDAADKDCTINELPYECLNGNGLIVGGTKPEWVNLYGLGNANSQFVSNIQIQEDGKMSGAVSIARMGYAAQAFRTEVGEFANTDKYVEDFADRNLDWDIEEHELKGINELNNRITQKLEVSLNNKSIFAGDLIYITPLIANSTEENPFKMEERKYPVDFGFKFKENEMVIFNLPDGYAVEELPETFNAILPESKATYLFSVQKIGDKQVQVVSNLAINQPVFQAEDYVALKELFNHIIEKQSQQIILKKI
ncbi:DUF3857 domain-containing protein [Draconibacterium sp. IB214405]|uniref:DUF3857 domain-containing protein n=1 Tax=Draconibacterium sp. IB214405 TaxID=3097352 RepID=UPI002A0B1281|nr:DUF3857 domain-containing protein [Draconibacterium sp. IB214405]MDX8340266.1 DUF3857 domain-containing protein [Draconibacterium sp. IB214405]